jgi:hypothetical protein
MNSSNLFKRIVLAAAALTFAMGVHAGPTVFNEPAPPGTGDLLGTALDAGSASSGLVINGNLLDGRGGQTPNASDLYKFSVGYAGRYHFTSVGSSVPDLQLFLFNSTGLGLFFSNLTGGSITQGSFTIDNLGIGDYYIGVSFFGVDPFDTANKAIFDTLGATRGSGMGGALDSWLNASASNQPGDQWDISGYRVSISVPEPGALSLALLALVLMGAARRRA